MPITVYNDVILPASIMAAAGLQGKNVRRNQRTQAPSGQKAVNVQQARTLRQYEFGVIPIEVDIWQRIEAACEVTEFGAYGMLIEDPKDSIVHAGEGFLYPYNAGLVGAIGVGYGVPGYRLYKRTTSIGSTRTKDRRITRPQAGLALLRGALAVTLGAAPGNAAVNLDTGVVTFVADSSSTITAVTPGATTSITLTAALAGVAVGERLYIAGMTGTIGAALNGASHLINAIAGSVYTLAINTTGLAWISGGSGYAYPQATEALTWSGNFYVPVHLSNDVLDWSLARPDQDEDNRLFVGPSVLLDEVFEG